MIKLRCWGLLVYKLVHEGFHCTKAAVLAVHDELECRKVYSLMLMNVTWAKHISEYTEKLSDEHRHNTNRKFSCRQFCDWNTLVAMNEGIWKIFRFDEHHQTFSKLTLPTRIAMWRWSLIDRYYVKYHVWIDQIFQHPWYLIEYQITSTL